MARATRLPSTSVTDDELRLESSWHIAERFGAAAAARFTALIWGGVGDATAEIRADRESDLRTAGQIEAEIGTAYAYEPLADDANTGERS